MCMARQRATVYIFINHVTVMLICAINYLEYYSLCKTYFPHNFFRSLGLLNSKHPYWVLRRHQIKKYFSNLFLNWLEDEKKENDETPIGQKFCWSPTALFSKKALWKTQNLCQHIQKLNGTRSSLTLNPDVKRFGFRYNEPTLKKPSVDFWT